jgi:hypothetical protein
MIKPRLKRNPQQNMLASHLNEVKRMGAEIRNQERFFATLVRAQLRYLYDKATIEQLEEQYGISAVEIRSYIVARGFLLRVRW